MTADADWQRQLAENARRTQNLRDRVAGIRVTETSPDGVVRVTVSASGVVTDLVLTDRRNLPLAYVGTQIMDCIRRAQARLPDLVRQAMLETVGVRDAGAQLILDGVRQRFPDIPTDPRARVAEPPPPPRPRVAPGRDDEDNWGEGPIMEALEGDRR